MTERWDILGLYQVVSLLASSTFSDVYRAWDRKSERDVAINMLRSDIVLPQPDHVVQRMADVVGRVSELRHPHIASTYDVGAFRGNPFVVMEYVEGRDLSAVMREGPLPLRVALEIVAQIAEGLAVLHSNRIVHRDLKPQNILITSADSVKIVDFGISHFLNAGADAVSPAFLLGAKFGTFAYSAPEQLREHAISPSVDMYSLGVILYELIVGELPLRLDSTSPARLFSHASPAIFGNRTEMPSSVEAILRTLLADDPRQRSRAQEVAEQLRLVSSDIRAEDEVMDELWHALQGLNDTLDSVITEARAYRQTLALYRRRLTATSSNTITEDTL